MSTTSQRARSNRIQLESQLRLQLVARTNNAGIVAPAIVHGVDIVFSENFEFRVIKIVPHNNQFKYNYGVKLYPPDEN
jgi:hypothetical protein